MVTKMYLASATFLLVLFLFTFPLIGRGDERGKVPVSEDWEESGERDGSGEIEDGPDYAFNDISTSGMSFNSTSLYLKGKQNVSMNCRSNGYPQPKCYWTFCNGSCFKIFRESCDIFVGIAHAVNVSCTASNVEVHSSDNTSIVVVPESRSAIVRDENGTEVSKLTRQAGDSLQLECSSPFGSELATSYQWVLHPNRDILEKTQTLKRKLTRNDSGTYICKTSDYFGQNITSITIDVQYDPYTYEQLKICTLFLNGSSSPCEMKFYSNPPIDAYIITKDGIHMKTDALNAIQHGLDGLHTFNFSKSKVSKSDAGLYKLSVKSGLNPGNVDKRLLVDFTVVIHQDSPAPINTSVIAGVSSTGLLVVIVFVVILVTVLKRRRKLAQKEST